MKDYISLENYPRYLGIEKGNTIFVSSDSTIMMWDAMSNNQEIDLNNLIDGFVNAVGENGTVIFPTYNWDFCSGQVFDYLNTPCKTGILGTLALKRQDFRRTKHPIYSFAVYGKYQNQLCELDNKDSFALDSPFGFFYRNNVTNYIIDVSLKNSFTFTHFAEEQSGLVNYRFIKEFNSDYIDAFGEKTNRTYSMFVRKLELDVRTLVDPIEEDFIAAGVEKIQKINSSNVKIINMRAAYDMMIMDIRENKSRKLCSYKGQED